MFQKNFLYPSSGRRLFQDIGTYQADYLMSNPGRLENVVLTVKNFKSPTEACYD
jgi:hypothetical protein